MVSTFEPIAATETAKGLGPREADDTLEVVAGVGAGGGVTGVGWS